MKPEKLKSERIQPGERVGRGERAERLVRRVRVPLGFVFAAAFLVFARPSVGSLARSLVLVVPGLLLRAYAAGYVRKNAELTKTGPYGHTRNPLYLGSLLAALGFVAASREWLLVVAFCLLFGVVYETVIRSEERYLAAHFPGFAEYMERVPRMFPGSFGERAAIRPNGEAGGFSPALWRRHREYNSAMGAVAIYAALLLLLLLRQRGMIPGR